MARKKDGTFEKGTSGNPGGRPKAPVRLRELYDNDGCDDLIYRRLRKWMDQDDDAKASIAAMDRLMERRYGKVAPTDDNGDAVKDTNNTIAWPEWLKPKPETPANG
jgi:hypothetical protein